MSHDWSSRHWAIIPYPPADGVWASVLEEKATCRRSLDAAGSLVLVKWEGATPAALAGVTVYDHAGILELLSGPDWSPPPPEPAP